MPDLANFRQTGADLRGHLRQLLGLIACGLVGLHHQRAKRRRDGFQFGRLAPEPAAQLLQMGARVVDGFLQGLPVQNQHFAEFGQFRTGMGKRCLEPGDLAFKGCQHIPQTLATGRQ